MPMKKSIIISFIIFLSVTGWFLSGQISISGENIQNELNSQNIDENNNIIIEKNNSLKVESKVIYAEEIVQSITLQGQTVYNRTINVKSETIVTILNASAFLNIFLKKLKLYCGDVSVFPDSSFGDGSEIDDDGGNLNVHLEPKISKY